MQLTISSPGVFDTLHFTRDPAAALPLAFQDVEIDVRALVLNFKDLLVALGKVDEPALGMECAGVVRRVGSGCAHLLPGDRVVACATGVGRSLARVDGRRTARLPD